MLDFNYKSLPWNIIFGAGKSKQLDQEIKKLGKNRVLILTTPEQAAQGKVVQNYLGNRAVGLFSDARMHVPVDTLASAASMAIELKADCTVAIGGGSTTGLSKALAVGHDIDNVVIPTSYAGSEMTDIWAVTENNRKVTARNIKAVPTLTIYDPKLTLTLPPKFAAASGLNAIAQAVVNVATDNLNPIVSSLAQDAIRALSGALPVIMSEPTNLDARSQALYGASMAGAALGTGSTSLHHRLCHTFGGTFNTPHAETHAIMLPHSVAYNASSTLEGTHKVAQALDCDDAAMGLYELAWTLGAPLALKNIGISESDIDVAVSTTLEKSFPNPQVVDPLTLRYLITNAYHGHLPQTYSELSRR